MHLKYKELNNFNLKSVLIFTPYHRSSRRMLYLGTAFAIKEPMLIRLIHSRKFLKKIKSFNSDFLMKDLLQKLNPDIIIGFDIICNLLFTSVPETYSNL